jgi:hypothetical protein
MKRKTQHAESMPTRPVSGGGEDRIASLFQPDALLGDQYLENFRRTVPLEPEKALLLAVLEDGVRSFQDNVLPRNRKKQMLFEDAQEWLFNDDGDWLFSFVSICSVLGLDPSYIRRGLRQWQERARRKHQRGSRPPQQRLVA